MSPESPCLNVPEWVPATVRSINCAMVVGSLAVLLAGSTSPPPETVAVLVTLAGASSATLTVSVRGG